MKGLLKMSRELLEGELKELRVLIIAIFLRVLKEMSS